MDLELAAMQIVGNAGESRSLCFEALSLAKKGEFEEAEKKLREAREVFLKAHEVQTELITEEVEGNVPKIGLLMVHAQDHLMTSLLCIDLAQEFVDVYKKIG